MIRFFQSAYPSRLISLFFLALVLWLPAFISPTANQIVWGVPFYDALINLLPNGRIIPIIAFFLFFISSIYVNEISIKTGLAPRNSYLGAFIFIIAAGSMFVKMQLSPYLVAGFFFILFFLRMVKLQNTEFTIVEAFDTGLLLGVTALFYPAMMLLLLVIWLALLTYRIGGWRAYIVSLIGTIFPYFLLFLVYFMLNKPISPLNDIMNDVTLIPAYLAFDSIFTVTIISLLGLSVLIAFIHMASTIGNQKISIRQHGRVSLLSLIFVLLTILIFNRHSESAGLVAVPSALILCAFFSQLSKQKWANRFIMLLLLLVIMNQFYLYFYVA